MRPSRQNFPILVSWGLGVVQRSQATAIAWQLSGGWGHLSVFPPEVLKAYRPSNRWKNYIGPFFVYFWKGRGKKQGGCATFKFLIGKITAGCALLFKDKASGLCFPLYFSLFCCCLQIKWKEEWRKSYERCSFPLQTRARKGDFSA